ncbi:MAG: prefoldin subunit alpha [archaeon]
MEEKQQEMIFKLSMFEQQIKQIQQQTQAIEEEIFNLSSLSEQLDDLRNSEDKEMFASLGRGIFIKTKVLSDDFIVDIGNKNFVRKTIPETQEMINEQLRRLNEAKKELDNAGYEISKEIEKTINSIDSENKN